MTSVFLLWGSKNDRHTIWSEMNFRATLTRFNIESKPVALHSRDYGFLVLTIEYLDELGKRIVPATRLRFIPDPKLSVNQLMEFKKLDKDMRLFLSRNSAEGCSKITIRDDKLFISISHYTSEMELVVERDNFPAIRQIIDDLSIVVSTNTFFNLDLTEIKETGSRHLQEWKGYLLNFLPH